MQDGYDPWEIVITPDGRHLSQATWREEQLRNALVAHNREQAAFEYAKRTNPLMERLTANRKAAPKKGGRGKCAVCSHPDRVKIEELYRGKREKVKELYPLMQQAGIKISLRAVYSHFSRHYTPPEAGNAAPVS